MHSLDTQETEASVGSLTYEEIRLRLSKPVLSALKVNAKAMVLSSPMKLNC